MDSNNEPYNILEEVNNIHPNQFFIKSYLTVAGQMIGPLPIHWVIKKMEYILGNTTDAIGDVTIANLKTLISI